MFSINYLYFCSFLLCDVGFGKTLLKHSQSKPRVCIIGGSVSGLSAARYLLNVDVDMTIFEMTNDIGGTWVYNPNYVDDEYGDHIQSSMYKNLRTNIPKLIMSFGDYKVPDEMNMYPTHTEILAFINKFADDFGLRRFIKFNHKVINVDRIENEWRIIYKNRTSGDEYVDFFDYVIVGTGHSAKPNIPSIPNESKFQGKTIHSHFYRVPEVYTNSRVLVIGLGPSAVDISLDIQPYASVVYLSHHTKIPFKKPFPDNMVLKPGVAEFTENGVIFKDGTYAEVDEVIYGTGYSFDYPFIERSTGLIVAPTHVIPLYRDIVNINEPTMFFIGHIVKVGLIIGIDVQSKYIAALLAGNFTLPSQSVMRKEWIDKFNGIYKAGHSLKELHYIDKTERKYYDNLTSEAHLPTVPDVLLKMRDENTKHYISDLFNYRQYQFRIINDTYFETYINDDEPPSVVGH